MTIRRRIVRFFVRSAVLLGACIVAGTLAGWLVDLAITHVWVRQVFGIGLFVLFLMIVAAWRQRESDW